MLFRIVDCSSQLLLPNISCKCGPLWRLSMRCQCQFSQQYTERKTGIDIHVPKSSTSCRVKQRKKGTNGYDWVSRGVGTDRESPFLILASYSVNFQMDVVYSD
jgi:hypothetical protein